MKQLILSSGDEGRQQVERHIDSRVNKSRWFQRGMVILGVVAGLLTLETVDDSGPKGVIPLVVLAPAVAGAGTERFLMGRNCRGTIRQYAKSRGTTEFAANMANRLVVEGEIFTEKKQYDHSTYDGELSGAGAVFTSTLASGAAWGGTTMLGLVEKGHVIAGAEHSVEALGGIMLLIGTVFHGYGELYAHNATAIYGRQLDNIDGRPTTIGNE